MKDLDKYCISSYEEGRIIFDKYTNSVIKRTNQLECLNNEAIRKILKNTNVRVVKILDFNNEKMVMEYVKGKNIEELLETEREGRREYYIILLKKIYEELEKSGIIIRDFAPRNIIYSEKTRYVTLVDFERGFIDISGCNNDEVKFIQSFILEEFYAFLSHDEVIKIFGENTNINFQSVNHKILENIYIGSRRYEIVKQIKHWIISQGRQYSDEKELALYFFLNKYMSYFINQKTKPKMIHQIDGLHLNDYIDELLSFIYLEINNEK